MRDWTDEQRRANARYMARLDALTRREQVEADVAKHAAGTPADQDRALQAVVSAAARLVRDTGRAAEREPPAADLAEIWRRARDRR